MTTTGDWCPSGDDNDDDDDTDDRDDVGGSIIKRDLVLTFNTEHK